MTRCIAKQTGSLWILALCFALASCAGTYTSKFTYQPAAPINQRLAGTDCYDSAVLLALGLSASRGTAKKVLAAVDASIDDESATVLKAQRRRHMGLAVGSGGEEIIVRLQTVKPSQTFVTVTTKTGFVGGAGMRAWSCTVVDQLIRMATPTAALSDPRQGAST